MRTATASIQGYDGVVGIDPIALNNASNIVLQGNDIPILDADRVLDVPVQPRRSRKCDDP